MRVIAGQAKGAKLVAPKGIDVRPTLDRVRESLFNILAPRLSGARFLDLYAGSGANGIEALSRGAVECVFIDNDSRSLRAIRRNLATTGLERSATVRRRALPEKICGLAKEFGRFDLIFADPPYAFADYERLLGLIRQEDLLQRGGVTVIEHDMRTRLPDEAHGYVCARRGDYGDTALSFFS
ncbi:MAG TPA: 16S rRNA (guanine(966)-N(2))-methyltransferase RsmD [Candidatus Hydrogenedentes bacterium]|nr:16S rRNA (guanine(966)-N(2))-methyltransferase RsmD [Candidatus Hydrogenedentota bacterium]